MNPHLNSRFYVDTGYEKKNKNTSLLRECPGKRCFLDMAKLEKEDKGNIYAILNLCAFAHGTFLKQIFQDLDTFPFSKLALSASENRTF